jgi:hypothetical protein
MAKLAVQPPGDNTLVGGAYGGHGGKGIFGLNEQQLTIVRQRSWPVFASLSWASVMWMFRWYPEMLQPSLRNSMTYMYVRRFSFVPLLPLGASLLFFTTDTGADVDFSLVQIQQRGHMGRLGQFPLAQQMKLSRTFMTLIWIPIVHFTRMLTVSLLLLRIACSLGRFALGRTDLLSSASPILNTGRIYGPL